MDTLIIVKWLTNYETIPGSKPPSIITTMITMFLGFGVQDANNIETELIPLQTSTMRILLITALICIPLMLLVKPIYENHKNQ